MAAGEAAGRRRAGGGAAARRGRRLLLVFPTTSTGLMGGSIGELTALVRLARSLPRGWARIGYAELVRAAWDPHPRVDGLLQSLGGGALCEMVRGAGGGVELREGAAGETPDLVVLSSFRAFFQFPKMPQLLAARLARWRQAGCRLAVLDPCGDSFVCAAPAGMTVLLPRPFTYDLPAREGQVVFAAPAPAVTGGGGGSGGSGGSGGGAGVGGGGRRRHGAWLWVAAPWMSGFRRFRAAERVALLGLSRLGVEVSVLSPVDGSLPLLGAARRIDESLGAAALEAEVARHAVVVSANCRSVLAARAAALGVPLALVNPAALLAGGGFDAATEELLRAGAAEDAGPAPVAAEWRQLGCGSAAETVASFAALRGELAALGAAQAARLPGYAALPAARVCLEELLGR